MGGRVTAALAGTLMEEEDVEVRPERLPAMVTDVSVDICRIKKYFTGEACLLVEQVLTVKTHSGCVRSATGMLTIRLTMVTLPLHVTRV